MLYSTVTTTVTVVPSSRELSSFPAGAGGTNYLVGELSSNWARTVQGFTAYQAHIKVTRGSGQ